MCQLLNILLKGNSWIFLLSCWCDTYHIYYQLVFKHLFVVKLEALLMFFCLELCTNLNTIVYQQKLKTLSFYSLAEARQPLWRKIPISSSKINPYRIVIVIRLVVLAFFLRFRILTPAYDAYPLWLISVICEVWFAFSWILDQFPKWFPITRETYLDRLSLRFEREGEPNKLAPVDFYVSTVDPLKEPPIITANTVLSILSVDYPVDKVSCYVSDDGASMLLFDSLAETAEFARRWVPFCKKYSIEPRAPEFYFSQKIDYLKDKVLPTFVKDRRAMKVSKQIKNKYFCV